MQKLLICGCSGLVGSDFIQKLSHRHIPFGEVVCTYHRLPPAFLPCFSYIQVVDLASPLEWHKIFSRFRPTAIILLSNIRHFFPLSKVLPLYFSESNLPRLIIVGTTGVYSRYPEYSGVYKKLESLIDQYPGSSCLLRPSMIYGSIRDYNIHKVVSFIKLFRCYIIFGDGQSLMQPVFYADISDMITTVLMNSSVIGCYNLPGKYCMLYVDIVSEIFKALGIRTRILYVPIWIPYLALSLLPHFIRSRLPVSLEQVKRLAEDKAFNYCNSKEELGYSPLDFRSGIHRQIYF